MSGQSDKDKQQKSTNDLKPSQDSSSQALSAQAPKSTQSDSANEAKNSDAKSESIQNDAPTAINKKTDTETKSSKPKSGKTKKSAANRSPKSVPWTAVVALCLSLLVGVVGAFNYQQGRQMQIQGQNVASQTQQLESQFSTLQASLANLNQEAATFKRDIQQGQSNADSIKHTLQQISAQVSALAKQKGKDPLRWRWAEGEYLLSIANHRLLLEKDVSTAISALQDADRRLELLGDPGLLPIREIIAKEMMQLRSVSLPDIAGMSATISSLGLAIEQLPLVNKERLHLRTDDKNTITEVDSLSGMVQKIWQDMINLFSVQRSNEPIAPLLPPQDKHYLSQNLALKLEQARTALLSKNTTEFKQNIQDIQSWVQQYFDEHNSAVSNLLETLSSMNNAELNPPLPDISQSLREMRAWIKVQERSASSAPSQEPSEPENKRPAEVPS